MSFTDEFRSAGDAIGAIRSVKANGQTFRDIFLALPGLERTASRLFEKAIPISFPVDDESINRLDGLLVDGVWAFFENGDDAFLFDSLNSLREAYSSSPIMTVYAAANSAKSFIWFSEEQTTGAMGEFFDFLELVSES